MNVDTDRIRERAHEIWIADGRPAGKEIEHWKRAEQELFAETNYVGAAETGGNGQGQKQPTDSNGVNRPSEERPPQPAPRERLHLKLSGDRN